MARIPKWRTRGHGSIAFGISLPAGKKRLSAAEKQPLNVENILAISGLGTIWPSWPAAEFCDAGRELAAEFGIRYLAYSAFKFSITN
jgi:hypothetical protein